MAQTSKEKRSRFARIFPPRIEKVVDQFRMISNCSSKSNYDWNSETVAKVWVHVLIAMTDAASDFGLEIDFTINGKTVSELRDEGSIQSLLEPETTLF